MSQQKRPADDQSTRSSPPRKKMKRKSATRRSSTAEPRAHMKIPAISGRATQASSVSVREEHGVTGNLKPSTITLKKKRERRSHSFGFQNEHARAALMEQWATLRMSRGTLLSSNIASRLSDTTPHLSSNDGNQELSSEVAEPDKELDLVSASDHIEPTCPRPFVASNAQVDSLAPQITSSEGFPISEYDSRYPSSSTEIRQLATEVAPSQYAREGPVEAIGQALPYSMINGSPEVANQSLASDSEVTTLQSTSTSIMSKLDILTETTLPMSTSAPIEPEDHLTRASPPVVDVVPGFNMLDLHEILSPWVPVSPTAPSIYVPPVVHHLIAGMKNQLEIEYQARTRAEELYLEEVRKRVRMEAIVDGLETKTGARDISASSRITYCSAHTSAGRKRS